ncbi:MAG: cupredoxin domain-containing protein [Chloroflexia bacterium]|nr:cupredoxin domain-containing protein [Chloroflexia bacterium]
MLRSRLVVLSLACLIALAGGLLRDTSGAAQSVNPTGYPVTINSGECPAPDPTAAYEVGTTLPWGLTETADNQIIAGAVLTARQVVNEPLDDFIQVGQPFTVVVASPDDASTVVACGDIVNEIVDGQLAVKLAPVGDAGVAGVALLDRDEQGFLGLGGEEVQVIAYVLTDLGSAPAAATTDAATTEATADATTSDGSAAVTIDAEDIYFRPNVITLPADTPVTVTFTNQGQIVHNFSVTDRNNPGLENLNIVVTLNPGETRTFTINAPAGDYYFFCDQPGHEAAGMRGYLQIADGAEISTEEATVTPRAG